MNRIKDRTGQKINNWTFIKFLKLSNKKNAKWLCKCDCGNEVVVLAYNIVSEQSKRCLKCMAIAHIKSYEGNIPTPVWKTILTNAKRRNHKVNITRDYAYSLFLKQNKKCAISGLDIKFAENNQDYNKRNQTASLDRIDSSKGYIKENIQWVHKDINIMKNEYSMDKLLNYCKLIYNYNSG